MPADLKSAIETKITDLKTAKDNTTPDIAVIKSATESLSTELQKIGQHMQQNSSATPAGNQQAGQTGPQTPPKEESGEGNVRDAEVK
ncbi:MAG: hypothetical protein B7W98_01715 [Parcubacteria group bacterium 20-58-5]|nr:MAG: hypothetical protein B7W98_01715 [Parcubacteria group bacterium 20-58-5]